VILSRFFWSRRTEGRVHRVVPNGKDDVPTSQTGVPGVDLCAEERNGRGQMLDEKNKKQTRDGLGIPGLLAEPTGTDGFRVLCHQFYTSSLLRQGSCIRRCNACLLKRKQLREALLLSFIKIKTLFLRKSGSQVGIAAHQPAFRTGRDPFGVIRLKPPQGAFPHPASLRLIVGDALVCDN
jgi:hypothetical protein